MIDKKINVGILGISANPPSIGHLQIINYVLNKIDSISEIWLAPTYKHTFNKNMLSYEHRYNMCNIMIKNMKNIKVFDYEYINNLSGDTYTFIKTLKNDKKYENYNFLYIIGGDNCENFNKWFNYEELERLIRFVIIPRVGYDINLNAWYLNKPHIFLTNEDNNPIMNVSSTFIRNKIKNNDTEDILKYINEDVFKYIKENNLYKD
jgi:nicotinate-nucleotide adenylyltransferase